MMSHKTCTGTSPGELDAQITDALHQFACQHTRAYGLATVPAPTVHFSTARDGSFINFSALLVWA